MSRGAKAELEERKAKRQAVLAELPPAVRKALELDDPQEGNRALQAALVRRILEYIATPAPETETPT